MVSPIGIGVQRPGGIGRTRERRHERQFDALMTTGPRPSQIAIAVSSTRTVIAMPACSAILRNVDIGFRPVGIRINSPRRMRRLKWVARGSNPGHPD